MPEPAAAGAAAAGATAASAYAERAGRAGSNVSTGSNGRYGSVSSSVAGADEEAPLPPGRFLEGSSCVCVCVLWFCCFPEGRKD